MVALSEICTKDSRNGYLTKYLSLGVNTPYNGLYGEAPPERGTFPGFGEGRVSAKLKYMKGSKKTVILVCKMIYNG